MPKIIISSVLVYFSVCIATIAQIPYPSFGDRFTPYDEVLAYLNSPAFTQNPKIQKINYGLSNEGRELQLVAVSAPENIERLANIKNQHLIRNHLKEGIKTNESIPAIVWLSFNVHGNEASGTETALKVLAYLNSKSAEHLLQNLIVLVDPCLNPDGRERYVSWYRETSGDQPNPHKETAEHHESWPGGRYNHYLADLNRDWLWQIQRESQQRMKVFHEWMPEVHADFHEMDAETSYFFPPAAEPLHEQVTDWQKQAHHLFGSGIRKNFDENHWDYYTREEYDLLYPGYGDSYPIFNGSIGFTLEQAGSGRAGLAYIRKNGDTLKLMDRINHHFEAAKGILSTANDLAELLKKQQQMFFDETIKNGAGAFKAYLIKNTHPNKTQALTDFLNKLGISYAAVKQRGNQIGYNFQSKTKENFTADIGDLVVSTQQAKGKLVDVIFEPQTFISDSNTYDITAWSLPYLFNVNAFGMSEQLSTVAWSSPSETTNTLDSGTPYAWAVEWQNSKVLPLTTKLLALGFTLKYHANDYASTEKDFTGGVLLIKNTAEKQAQILSLANEFGIALTPVWGGKPIKGLEFGSEKLHQLTQKKVALITGKNTRASSVGEIWHFFENTLAYPINLIDEAYFAQVDPWLYDIIILPDGKYQKSNLDESTLSRWIKDGGRLIMFENACDFFAKNEELALPSKNIVKESDKPIFDYEEKKSEFIKYSVSGAIYEIKLDNKHPLAFGYGSHTYGLFEKIPVYNYLQNGHNVGISGKYISGAVGQEAKSQINEAMIYAASSHGEGSLVYFAVNPLFRGFWYDGQLLVANALFMPF